MDKKDGIAEMEKLFNFRPVFFCAIFLALGVLFYFAHYFYALPVFWVLALFILSFIPVLFYKRKGAGMRAMGVIALLNVFFFLGFFGLFSQLEGFSSAEEKVGDHHVRGYVVAIEKTSYGASMLLDSLSFDGERVDGKLIAYLSSSFLEEVSLCDEVFLEGEVESTSLEVEEISYTAKKIRENVRFTMQAEEVLVTGAKFDLLLFLRMRVEETIEAGMDETPASVMKALIFGDTSDLDGELYENVRRGGLAHIFAVSGLHVGALFAFCLWVLEKTALRDVKKIMKFFSLFALLFLYAGLCGFSASVMRAMVVCLVTYAFSLILLKVDFLEAIGLSAIIILILSPSALFEVGFQLSFLACLGITFLSKPIGHVFVELQNLYRKVFPRKLTDSQKKMLEQGDTLPPSIGERIYRSITSVCTMSLSAQIFTAPLQLLYFGYVSGWGLILNGIFVPFVSAIFAFLLLLVVLASICPVGLASMFLFLPNVVWSAVLLFFQMFDFSSFALSNLQLSVFGVVIYYAGCLFFTDKWNVKNSFSRVLAILCFLAFGISMVLMNI